MYILEVSESAKPILAFLGKVLNVIHILAPIALIVFVSIDLAKAVISQDDEQIAKVTKCINNRVIVCLAIFFMPTIVEVIFSKAFISLNIDENTYEEILSTYKSVIYSDRINTQDDSKNNEISGNMKYSLSDPNTKTFDESVFISIAKNVTPYLFSDSRFVTLLSSISDENFVINYKNNSYTFDSNFKMTYSDITAKEVTYNGEYVIANATLKKVLINGNDKYDEIGVDYYFKKSGETYKLEKVNIKSKEEISNYIGSISSEENSNSFSSADIYISVDPEYDYSKLNDLSKEDIKSIRDSNISNVVILNTLYDTSIIGNATGFFISNGVVATSWSYLQTAFMNGQTIAVNDINNKFYNCDGVVAIDVVNDIAVIKLDKEVKRKVTFGNGSVLSKNDPVITIISKTGYGFTSVAGIVSSSEDNIISVLPLSKNDWGSPLFDRNGYVVGINTSKLVNSELSNASGINSLKKLQQQLSTVKFSDISVTKVDDLKKQYYYKDDNIEEIKNSIPEKVWEKYKNIGKLEENIVLDLIKASYYDGIVSLRYHNNTSIDNMVYQEAFAAQLEKEGYKKAASTSDKILYKKGTSKVIIMSEFDYLIILIVR